MPVAKRRVAADPREFLVDGVDEGDDVFEEDKEDVRPARSSGLQSGWEAAKKASKSDNKKYTNEFRFTEEQQVIKFLSAEPFVVFDQHWLDRTGKRSFVCLDGIDDRGCPACEGGDTPRTKVGFSVVNLSSEDPVVEMMLTSPTLTRQLAALAEDPKTGPLDRIYYAVSRSGGGPKVAYQITPIKARDLQEDWSVSADSVEQMCDGLTPLDESIITVTPYEELKEIVRDLHR